jgi:anthranilate synthase component 1
MPPAFLFVLITLCHCARDPKDLKMLQEDFKLKNQTKRKATVVSLLSDLHTPLSVFEKLACDDDTAFLFESTEGDSRLARYSIIGIEPCKKVSFLDGRAMVEERVDDLGDSLGNDAAGLVVSNKAPGTRGAKYISQEINFSDPTEVLQALIEESGLEPLELDLPFTGGLAGYLGYASNQYFDGIKKQAKDPFKVPEAYYGLYDTVIVLDHHKRLMHFISYRGEAHIKLLLAKLNNDSMVKPIYAASIQIDEDELFKNVEGPLNKESFMELVLQAKEYILEGQVFQIVVAHRFTSKIRCNATDIYRVLAAINPSPYAYILKFPGFSYLGSSPETFVSCQNKKVTLKALAGTRPRGLNEEEDNRLALELKANEKEMAEHRMLVDLGRNDLGRVCQPGTVEVSEIGVITKYAHVMHLATEITGKLKNEKSCFDVLRSCFPRGTVSGAPKVRAMKLLAGLESEQRGIYSGVVGYIDLKGNTDGAIAIRSGLVKDGFCHVNAGAGIVYDSDPESEYWETVNKAKSVIKAIGMANKIMEAKS